MESVDVDSIDWDSMLKLFKGVHSIFVYTVRTWTLDEFKASGLVCRWC